MAETITASAQAKSARGRRRDVLVDEADLPGLRHIGRDQQQPLRRHEGLDPAHQPVGVVESAEGRRVARKDTQNPTLIPDRNRTTHQAPRSLSIPRPPWSPRAARKARPKWFYEAQRPILHCVLTSGGYIRLRSGPQGPALGFCPISTLVLTSDHETSQHCHHRPCRPRQDHAGGPAAAAIRLLPGEPAGGRARHGFQRSRARARDHDPVQGHLAALARQPHQYRGHPRPRRFRRRGRAHPQHGGGRHRAGGCRRGPAAADQVRGLKALKVGLRPIVAINKVDRPDARPSRSPTRCSTCSRRSMRPRSSSISRCSTAPPRKAGWRRPPRARKSPWRRCSTWCCAMWRRRTSRPGRCACLCTILEANPYLGRIVTGRITSGSIKPNQSVKVLDREGKLIEDGRVTKVLAFRGLERQPVEEAFAGDIVAVAGLPEGHRPAHHLRPRGDQSAAGPADGSADACHDIPGQRFPARRHRRQQGHQPHDPRPAVPRGRGQRGPQGHRIRRQGRRRGSGPRRAAARHPDRDHAARGLRARGLAPEGAVPARPRHWRHHGADRGGGDRRRRGPIPASWCRSSAERKAELVEMRPSGGGRCGWCSMRPRAGSSAITAS